MSKIIMQSKSSLRQEMKQKIQQISDKEKTIQSRLIVKKVLTSEIYTKSKRISIFLPMKEEVDTLPLLKSMFKDGKDCFIPNYKGPEMIMVPLKSWSAYEQLPVTKWGIKQPAEFKTEEDAAITGGLDLIFMPGLAFTETGARLGRGKGYYDKYLTRCEQSGHLPYTMALLFRQQLVDSIPVVDHDKPIDTLIVPSQEEIESES